MSSGPVLGADGPSCRTATRPVRVTISDVESGRVLEEIEVANDYVLITAGNRYVKSLQVVGRTHMIAVAVAKPGEAP